MRITSFEVWGPYSSEEHPGVNSHGDVLVEPRCAFVIRVSSVFRDEELAAVRILFAFSHLQTSK